MDKEGCKLAAGQSQTTETNELVRFIIVLLLAGQSRAPLAPVPLSNKFHKFTYKYTLILGDDDVQVTLICGCCLSNTFSMQSMHVVRVRRVERRGV